MIDKIFKVVMMICAVLFICLFYIQTKNFLILLFMFFSFIFNCIFYDNTQNKRSESYHKILLFSPLFPVDNVHNFVYKSLFAENTHFLLWITLWITLDKGWVFFERGFYKNMGTSTWRYKGRNFASSI